MVRDVPPALAVDGSPLPTVPQPMHWDDKPVHLGAGGCVAHADIEASRRRQDRIPGAIFAEPVWRPVRHDRKRSGKVRHGQPVLNRNTLLSDLWP